MQPPKNDAELGDFELATLEPLAREIPNIDSAVAEIARLSAQLTLPKGTIHVISDIHGDAAYRAHLVGVMARRAVARANEGGGEGEGEE